MDDAPRFEAHTPEQWRAWLAEHHASERSVWLIYRKASAGGAQLSYAEAVTEALAYGWVDSKGLGLDAERTMLYFARRKPGSGWSRPNKTRIEQLRAEGRMQPAGEAVIAAAVADGSWAQLDSVEDLVVPQDLAAALAAHPGAVEHWDAFTRSVRRQQLEWLAQAKRPATRQARALQIAERAARGERARG